MQHKGQYGAGAATPAANHWRPGLATSQALFRTVRVSVLVGLGMLAVAIYLKVDKVRWGPGCCLGWQLGAVRPHLQQNAAGLLGSLAHHQPAGQSDCLETYLSQMLPPPLSRVSSSQTTTT